MPYYNFNEDQLPDFTSVYDIVIVGAGAAGILLALELTKDAVKVLVLETGHFEEDEKRQVLNEVLQTGKNLSAAKWGRKRAIGGTTIAWGGQSLPFSELDFKKRDYAEESGWPINLEDLEFYYDQANLFMGIDTFDYEEGMLQKLKVSKPNPQDDHLNYHTSKWARQPNFKKLYEHELKTKIDVIYNAQVTDLLMKGHNVDQVVIANFNKKVKHINVNKLILSTGAIEANRMLLILKKENKNLFTNNSDILGKYFMDHPCLLIGTIDKITKTYDFQKQFNTHIYKKRKYSFRLSLTQRAQESNMILNSSLSIMFEYDDKNNDPIHQLKTALTKFKITSMLWIIKNLSVYIKMVYALIKDGFIYKPNAIAKLVVMAEQEPISESYISLSNVNDIFGKPKSNINWNISPKTGTSIKAIVSYFENSLNTFKWGVLVYNPLHNNLTSFEMLSDVNHHMGGTRMGVNDTDSIVDKDLKVWGVSNLFVCSTSVFPTGSHSNPTLTLLALAKRLSDYLKTKN